MPNGRAAALEVLIDTPRIRDLIKRGETDAVKDAMEQGVNEGCATFDGAIYDLVMAGRVAESEAVKVADSANNLRIRLDRLRHSTGAPPIADAQLRLVPLPARTRTVSRG
jgi:twitching motility protein PilU